MQIYALQSKRTINTRMNIGEAAVELLKELELKQLRVLSIVKKAGISHMTFYKYYSTPRAALEDYLHIVIEKYLVESGYFEGKAEFLTYDHIVFALNFFDKYRTFFLTMKARGLYSVLTDSVNEFVKQYIRIEEKVSVYKQYSYAGSLLNCFLMWEESGKADRTEDVARTIYQLYGTSQSEV